MAKNSENQVDNAIELGNGYWLFYDKYNYYVQKECDNPKTGRKYMRRVSGYEHGILDAIDSCLEHRISDESVKTLKEMSKLMQQMRRDLKTWKVALKVDK